MGNILRNLLFTAAAAALTAGLPAQALAQESSAAEIVALPEAQAADNGRRSVGRGAEAGGDAFVFDPQGIVVETRDIRMQCIANQPRISGNAQWTSPGETIVNFNANYRRAYENYRDNQQRDLATVGAADLQFSLERGFLTVLPVGGAAASKASMNHCLPFFVAFASVLPASAAAQHQAVPPVTQADPNASVIYDARGNAEVNLERIEALDHELNSVIAHHPEAADDASIINGASLLAGRTVLIKDNIETRELPTTAGSLALEDNDTGRDAPLIARLRDSGGVVLGKTNLSEWANFRSSESTSGWSAVGGITRNPYATDRNSCGSSSGSGAAVAAGFSWAAIGTETDGSITCPASLNGVVGFKPSVGLVSQTHIVPISASQDTAGPMARSVADAAMLLTAIAGPDYGILGPGDLQYDFTQGVETASLEGVRIGVLRDRCGSYAPLCAVYQQAVADLEAAGAVLVDVTYQGDPTMGRDEYTVLLYEFREGINAYLAGSPADIPVRSLDDLIAFNNANAETEMRWFGQDIFELAAQTTDQEAYEAARANSFNLAGPEGIDAMLAEHEVAFLIAPTRGPAWTTDLVNGDNFRGGIGIGSLAAIAGYPHLTVPMGHIEGLPVGLSFIGANGRDHAILQAGAAYERSRSHDLAQPRFAPWEPSPTAESN